jgi:hypothetical protein
MKNFPSSAMVFSRVSGFARMRRETSKATISRKIMAKALAITLLAVGLQAVGAHAQKPAQAPVPHVIQISVDALGGKYLEKFLQESPAHFTNFARLIKEGSTTLNARTDYSNTSTLPNHTCMVTGRPLRTPAEWQECSGHFWTWNGDFPSAEAPASLHATNPAGGYTASTFDVAHDNGLKTALYSGKSKFQVYATSYGPTLGAEHAKGRNKIDHVIISGGIHAKAMADLKANKPNYTFLHYPDMDSAGHAHGYLGDDYRNAAKQIDVYLGELLTMLDTDPEWKDRTAVIISADHGGEPETKGHGNPNHPYNYTIPFIVWGSGVAKGVDLYKANPTRTNPGEGRPAYAPTGQPIRNGDGGNLSLQLLGLPAVPGSHINSKQDLNVR